VHSVIHLPDDYESFGSLDNISCFKFESYLGAHIKGAVRGGFKPLQQIVHHAKYMNSKLNDAHPSVQFDASKPIKKKEHELQAFKKLNINHAFSIQVQKEGFRNNVVLLKTGKIVRVNKIVKDKDEILLTVQPFINGKSLSKVPIKSKIIHRYKVNTLGNKEVISDELIQSKIMLLPLPQK
jgi:hypothetical protein